MLKLSSTTEQVTGFTNQVWLVRATSWRQVEPPYRQFCWTGIDGMVLGFFFKFKFQCRLFLLMRRRKNIIWKGFRRKVSCKFKVGCSPKRWCFGKWLLVSGLVGWKESTVPHWIWCLTWSSSLWDAFDTLVIANYLSCLEIVQVLTAGNGEGGGVSTLNAV